jgi:plastocyanin
MSRDDPRGLARRAVLRAVGASAALTAGAAGAASADGADGHERSDGASDGASSGGDGPPAPRDPTAIDPVFGAAVAAGNPCAGDAGDDCLAAFVPPVRPSDEVAMEIEIPEALLAFGQFGAEEQVPIAEINAAVADEPPGGHEDDERHADDGGTDDEMPGGPVTADELTNPNDPVTIPAPGEQIELPVLELAKLLDGTVGIGYHPNGLHVAPGAVVLYSAETPDHAVAAFHPGHGRQRRVPADAPPISSPMPPAGGYWLYRFEREGVYDLYCPPHQTFGMVGRVVVHDGEGEVPSLDVAETGRPPTPENALPRVLGGLDPNVPSSAAALASDLLDPERIVDEGAVPWAAVVEAHRAGSR